jgi:hypothetical protein
MSEIQVLTTVQTQRLGLQNKVVRRLRALGCRIVAATLDGRLTIQVETDNAAALRRLVSCVVTDRSGKKDIVSVELEGCLVKWEEDKQSNQTKGVQE